MGRPDALAGATIMLQRVLNSGRYRQRLPTCELSQTTLERGSRAISINKHCYTFRRTCICRDSHIRQKYIGAVPRAPPSHKQVKGGVPMCTPFSLLIDHQKKSGAGRRNEIPKTRRQRLSDNFP
jgi:hypothetical protein